MCVWRGKKKKPLLRLNSVSTSWPRIVWGQTAKAAIPKSTTGKWDAVYSRSAFIMTLCPSQLAAEDQLLFFYWAWLPLLPVGVYCHRKHVPPDLNTVGALSSVPRPPSLPVEIQTSCRCLQKAVPLGEGKLAQWDEETSLAARGAAT